MNPRKVVDLPMSGAWHSIFMEPAVVPFRDYLASIELKPPSLPVACNVTGKELPSEREKLLDASCSAFVQTGSLGEMHQASYCAWKQGFH